MDSPWSAANPELALPLKTFNFDDERQVSLNVNKDRIDEQVAANRDWGNNARPGNVVVERWIVIFPEDATSATATAAQSDTASARNRDRSGNAAPAARSKDNTGQQNGSAATQGG